MKFIHDANIYSASNVYYNCNTETAWSYNWWQFVRRINGKLVFNTYSYSPTTVQHQYKVRRLLADLGVKIDMEIECPEGLQSSDMVASVKEHYSKKVVQIQQAIERPRSQAKKNEERRAEIQRLAETSAKFVKLVEDEK